MYPGQWFIGVRPYKEASMCAVGRSRHILPQCCYGAECVVNRTHHPRPDDEGGQDMTLPLILRQELRGRSQGHPVTIRGEDEPGRVTNKGVKL